MMAGPAQDVALAAPYPIGRVHIIGAGPVGLFLAALLQSIEGQQVLLYERRSLSQIHTAIINPWRASVLPSVFGTPD